MKPFLVVASFLPGVAAAVGQEPAGGAAGPVARPPGSTRRSVSELRVG